MPRLLLAVFCLAICTTAWGADAPRKKLLLISQGPDGHPQTTHEYVAGLQILEKTLAPLADQLEIQQVRADGDWLEGPELLKSADGVVLYLAEGAKWIQAEPRRFEAFTQLAARGGGIVALHWATGTKDARYIAGFVKLLGACHGGEDRKYKFLETSVVIAERDHPITAGLTDFTIKDEFYYQLKLVKDDKHFQPLLRAKIDGELYPVAWAWERADGGRSFGFTALHYHENWQRAEYRRFVAQGVAWTLKLTPPTTHWPGEVTARDLKLK